MLQRRNPVLSLIACVVVVAIKFSYFSMRGHNASRSYDRYSHSEEFDLATEFTGLDAEERQTQREKKKKRSSGVQANPFLD